MVLMVLHMYGGAWAHAGAMERIMQAMPFIEAVCGAFVLFGIGRRILRSAWIALSHRHANMDVHIAPTIINTFLERYDFSGKKIVLFATSGGSGFGKTTENLQPSAPNAKIIEGKLLNGRHDKASLAAWAAQF